MNLSEQTLSKMYFVHFLILSFVNDIHTRHNNITSTTTTTTTTGTKMINDG